MAYETWTFTSWFRLWNFWTTVYKYKCDKCDRSFGLLGNMVRHKETVHEGLKKYNCTECSATFSEMRTVRKHKKQVHESNLNITCKQCNIFFSSQNRLRSHLMKKIHTSETEN